MNVQDNNRLDEIITETLANSSKALLLEQELRTLYKNKTNPKRVAEIFSETLEIVKNSNRLQAEIEALTKTITASGN